MAVLFFVMLACPLFFLAFLPIIPHAICATTIPFCYSCILLYVLSRDPVCSAVAWWVASRYNMRQHVFIHVYSKYGGMCMSLCRSRYSEQYSSTYIRRGLRRISYIMYSSSNRGASHDVCVIHSETHACQTEDPQSVGSLVF